MSNLFELVWLEKCQVLFDSLVCEERERIQGVGQKSALVIDLAAGLKQVEYIRMDPTSCLLALVNNERAFKRLVTDHKFPYLASKFCR